MKLVRFTLVLFAALSFFSCASTRTRAENAVHLTDRKAISLLAPSAISQPVDCVQTITADFRGKQITAQCLLLADESQIFMTVLNEFGTTIASLIYNADGAFLESSLFPRQDFSQYIIFDIQLCYYKSEALRQALAAAGLRFELHNASDAREIRSVFDGKTEIIRIEKDSGSIQCTNLLRGYQYTLTTLQ
ncbi:MAG: DUF3261 domain-containing protein [Treponema sp.]|nr:DUF3261 domain-containing protein [Treponema sp.]